MGQCYCKQGYDYDSNLLQCLGTALWGDVGRCGVLWGLYRVCIGCFGVSMGSL